MIKKLVIATLWKACDEPRKDGRETGFEFTYFMDPETRKLYEPNRDFEVTGDNLETMFHEVPEK